jgi:tetratricopeptide (TPR) repeat protein
MVVVNGIDEQSLINSIQVIKESQVTTSVADRSQSKVPLIPRKNSVSTEVRDDHDAVLQRHMDDKEVDKLELSFLSSLGSSNGIIQSPKTNGPIEELEEGLTIQKKRLGRLHGSITRTLHGLAIQYRVKGRYDKSILSLKEALSLLDERLLAVRQTEDNNHGKRQSPDEPVRSRSKIQQNEYQFEKRILEEMSAIYSTLGRTYSMRFMYNEAMDYYVKSVNMLVEAKYSGDDPKVEMMMRLMKRTESNRISILGGGGKNFSGL